jgi:hypothetical protein
LTLFAAASAGLHIAAFLGLQRATAPNELTFDRRSQTLSGDTLDVDPTASTPDEPDLPTATAAATPTPTPTPTPTVTATSIPTPSVARAAGMSVDASAGTATLFGAVGLRFSADLATTFTRAFPQAASADPLWLVVAPGDAGSADVTLVLDDDGRLEVRAIAGTPSMALRRGIERTLSLLAPRTFTAHAAVTKLRVRAHVAPDDRHDGLHGDVFALSGGSFSGDVGTAFFALPAGAGPGRRIDVDVRLLP